MAHWNWGGHYWNPARPAQRLPAIRKIFKASQTQRGWEELALNPAPRRPDVHVCLIERAKRTKRRSIVDFNKTLFTGPIIFNLMAEGGSSKDERARPVMSHYARPSWAETNWRRISIEETGRPRALHSFFFMYQWPAKCPERIGCPIWS